MSQAKVMGDGLEARLVGRADDMQQLVAVLGAARIATIVGGPGVGKTALAEAAAAGAPGAVVVRLTEVAAGAPVEPAIAAACGVREQPGSRCCRRSPSSRGVSGRPGSPSGASSAELCQRSCQRL